MPGVRVESRPAAIRTDGTPPASPKATREAARTPTPARIHLAGSRSLGLSAAAPGTLRRGRREPPAQLTLAAPQQRRYVLIAASTAPNKFACSGSVNGVDE